MASEKEEWKKNRHKSGGEGREKGDLADFARISVARERKSAL